MRIFFSNENTVKGHRICCSNSNDRDQLSVNKKTVKLNVNPSLTHVRTQSACYELKGDLSPLMLNEIFHDSLIRSKRGQAEYDAFILAWPIKKRQKITPDCLGYTVIQH